MTASTPAPQSEYVVCIDNAGYPVSLELHKIYRTLRDDNAADSGDRRVVYEGGEDYLYPAAGFVAIGLPEPVRSLRRRAARS